MFLNQHMLKRGPLISCLKLNNVNKNSRILDIHFKMLRFFEFSLFVGQKCNPTVFPNAKKRWSKIVSK